MLGVALVPEANLEKVRDHLVQCKGRINAKIDGWCSTIIVLQSKKAMGDYHDKMIGDHFKFNDDMLFS